MRIVIYNPFEVYYNPLAPELKAKVISAAGSDEVIFCETEPKQRLSSISIGAEEIFTSVSESAEVFFGYCPMEFFDQLPNVKWIQYPGAGIATPLLSALKDQNEITLTNSAGLYAKPAADQAFALLLALMRDVILQFRNVEKKIWQRTVPIELDQLTLGIIGMGGFGLEMARRGKGFDMNVICVEPFRKDQPSCVDEVLPMEKLPDLLQRSDVVMLACPLTDETHHLINAETIAMMKPSAYFINVTRGPIVDESALIEALQNDRIAGAGLDVFEREPLPKNSPLWALKNVAITPHIAGFSQHRPRRTIEFFCENLIRYRNGEPLKKIVDIDRGF